MTSFLPAARAVALCSCLSILASCDSGSDGTPLVTPQVVRLEIDAEHLFFAQAVLTLVPIDALHGDATLSAVGVSLPATYVVQGSKLTFWFGGPRTARLPTSLLGPERCPLTLQFVTLELDAKIEHGTIASVTGRGTGNAAFWLGHPSATDYEYGLTVVGTRDDAGPTSVIAQTDFVHPLAFDGVQIDAPIAPASLDFALQGVTAPVETLTKTIASLSTTELPVMDYPSVSPMPLSCSGVQAFSAVPLVASSS